MAMHGPWLMGGKAPHLRALHAMPESRLPGPKFVSQARHWRTRHCSRTFLHNYHGRDMMWRRCSRQSCNSKSAIMSLRTEMMPNGLECAYVSRQDLRFLYREVYDNKAYLRNGVDLKEGDTVLDIGGNVGFFAIKAAEICGASGCVVTAEPIPDTFRALERNVDAHLQWFRSNKDGASPAPVTPLNVGVGDGSASHADFTFYTRAAGWSTMQPDPSGVLRDMQSFLDVSLGDDKAGIPDSFAVRLGRFLQHRVPWLYRFAVRVAVWVMMLGKRVVHCKLQTVAQIMQEQRLSRLSLLKIDVERAELSVLRGVKEQDWARIDQVVMEVHDDPPGRLAEVQQLLSAAGFDSIVADQDAPLQGTSLYNLYCTKTPPSLS